MRSFSLDNQLMKQSIILLSIYDYARNGTEIRPVNYFIRGKVRQRIYWHFVC